MDLRKDDVLVIWLDRLGLVGLVNTVQDLSARDVGRLPWRPHTSVDGTTVCAYCVCVAMFVEEVMSRRVLGASVFLNGMRRRHHLRDTLSRVKQGGTMRLGEVLDALDIHDAEFRNDLAQIEASDFEVVVRRAVPPEKPEPSPKPPEPNEASAPDEPLARGDAGLG